MYSAIEPPPITIAVPTSFLSWTSLSNSGSKCKVGEAVFIWFDTTYLLVICRECTWTKIMYLRDLIDQTCWTLIVTWKTLIRSHGDMYCRLEVLQCVCVCGPRVMQALMNNERYWSDPAHKRNPTSRTSLAPSSNFISSDPSRGQRSCQFLKLDLLSQRPSTIGELFPITYLTVLYLFSIMFEMLYCPF